MLVSLHVNEGMLCLYAISFIIMVGCRVCRFDVCSAGDLLKVFCNNLAELTERCPYMTSLQRFCQILLGYFVKKNSLFGLVH